jgi:hypothetical protein
MKSLSLAAAMVETPMQELLTSAPSRCKTSPAGFGVRCLPSVSRWDDLDRKAPQAPCAFRQASIAAGAVATWGQRIGASSPAAAGGIDAT